MQVNEHYHRALKNNGQLGLLIDPKQLVEDPGSPLDTVRLTASPQTDWCLPQRTTPTIAHNTPTNAPIETSTLTGALMIGSR